MPIGINVVRGFKHKSSTQDNPHDVFYTLHSSSFNLFLNNKGHNIHFTINVCRFYCPDGPELQLLIPRVACVFPQNFYCIINVNHRKPAELIWKTRNRTWLKNIILNLFFRDHTWICKNTGRFHIVKFI